LKYSSVQPSRLAAREFIRLRSAHNGDRQSARFYRAFALKAITGLSQSGRLPGTASWTPGKTTPGGAQK